MEGKTFKILVPYNGVMAIATAEEQKSDVDFNYRVKFDNGFITEFNIYEPETEDNVARWNESGFGETQLAKDVGTAIDDFNEYQDEPFIVTLEKEKFFILPRQDPDEVLHMVYDDKELLCVIGLNENAEWESDADIDQEFVKRIGTAIEALSA